MYDYSQQLMYLTATSPLHLTARAYLCRDRHIAHTSSYHCIVVTGANRSLGNGCALDAQDWREVDAWARVFRLGWSAADGWDVGS